MKAHTSTTQPEFEQRWNPSDRDWIWFSWFPRIGASATYTSSWILPSGWTNHDENTDTTITDVKGDDHTRSNGVLISNVGATPGEYVIANRIVMTDGTQRIFERSVTLVVESV